MSARYTILGTIASGGMASVYLGRMMGSAGFSRPVAIKRLHPQLAAQHDFIAMLVDEARLAAQIRHSNVVDTLDLVVSDGAFSLVLEYVEGESLSALIAEAAKRGEMVPRPIALAILYGVLRGLEAAHEARNEEGQPLGIVHRDISPQNILVGVDGIPRIIDFGVAKAFGRMLATRPGEVRGKFAYMAPEQLLGRPVTRQVDVYATGVLLWELLVGARLFTGDDERVICAAVMRGAIRPPSEANPDVPREIDAVVMQATARELSERYLTARELLGALEPWETASDDEVGAWVRRLSAESLAKRHRLLQDAVSTVDRLSVDALLRELDLSRAGAAVGPHGNRAPSSSVGPESAEGVEVVRPASHAAPSRRGMIFAIGLGVLMAFVILAAIASVRRPVGAQAASGRGASDETSLAATNAAVSVDVPPIELANDPEEAIPVEPSPTSQVVENAAPAATGVKRRGPRPRSSAVDPRSYR
ncbi:MAG: hypothetical protein BGO98_26145 [Myxococcales bacterium 68-20]|nr:MAG: hypothetical protein BGO98_26145 [Myxococcales bacterium 68-20]